MLLTIEENIDCHPQKKKQQAGTHLEMLLERLRANDPAAFGSLAYADITQVRLQVEYSDEYIANITTFPPRTIPLNPPFCPFALPFLAMSS